MKRRNLLSIVILTALTITCSTELYAQESKNNPIPSSVQMLNIGPEARGTALGDAGVATTPDINSQHWNPAKYSFMESSAGASLSITPWLRSLVSDINLFYATGYYKLNKRNTVSASIKYFSLGDLVFTDEEGYEQGSYKPNEFSIDAAYALLLSDEFSGAVALRFIHSDLGYQIEDDGYSAGNAFAADIAFYYKKNLALAGQKANFMAGINISNIGTKITYDDGVTNEYLPANMRLGVGFWYEIDQYNKIGATVDFNKLLVPTPDYNSLTSDDDLYQAKLDYYDKSVPAAIFSSFGDAPDGGKEELQEIDICGGVEYSYRNMFTARLGYHHNNEYKGNLKYASAGLGIKYNFFNVDASYLFTIGNANNNSALNNTIRISLGFDVGMLLKKR
ncbi:MAG: type IX secretion system outer membrane channel protein PorV [Marinilabiliaceae bacterium]|nr:type IX secretion system outer membrane channel protein PorV [Marinilabiliaceae bacterium]